MLVVFYHEKHFKSGSDKNIIFDKEHLSKISVIEKEKYLDSILLLLKRRKNDSLTRDTYLKVGEEYYYLNNLKKSYSSSFVALKLSKEENDSSRIAKSLYFIGDCYESSQKDSAYYFYLQAQKIYSLINDNDKLGLMYFHKARVLFYDGRFVECEIEITKAIKILKNSRKLKVLYCCNNLMGNCLEKLIMYDQALKYHQSALEILKVMREQHLDSDEINNYNISSVINISNLYELKGDLPRSIRELSAVLTIDLKVKWPRLYANVLSNLAYSKMKNKEYSNLESMFLESLKIVDSLGYKTDALYKKIHLGEYYLTQKDTFKSVNILKEAFDDAVKMRNTNEVLRVLRLLTENDSRNKLFYANRYIKISDSINSIQSRVSNKYARIEYETVNIEEENKVLTRKNFNILIFSFGLFLILATIFVFAYLKYKNKELRFLKRQQNDSDEIYQLLSEQHEKINSAKEEEKNKIARELHDGVMNKVYGIRMNLGFLNSKIDEKTIEKRKLYISDLQNIENDIRTISHDLSRDSFLVNSDFNTLLSNLILNQEDVSNIEFIYSIDEEFEWEDIQNIYKINLYRIIQEAILNIHKYSNATKVTVKIELLKNQILKLSIIDNGIGFEVSAVKKGIGLTNIKERTNSLKGSFEIKSKIGEGTELMVLFNI